jgi:hypothetical protein
MEREAGVDDVFDDEDVASADLRFQILEEADAAAAAVGGELEEVQLVWHADRARQVGEKDKARFEGSYEDRVLTAIVARDVLAELGDAAADLLPCEVDLADALRRYDASSSLYRSARRAMSRL